MLAKGIVAGVDLSFHRLDGFLFDLQFGIFVCHHGKMTQ